jgi:hypothetical protein
MVSLGLPVLSHYFGRPRKRGAPPLPTGEGLDD